MRSFVKVKSSQNGEIALSHTDTGKSCPSPEFKTALICLLTLFAKIKFSRISEVIILIERGHRIFTLSINFYEQTQTNLQCFGVERERSLICSKSRCNV